MAAPVISSVSIANSPMKVGGTYTATITVADDGGSPFVLSSSTLGGFSLHGLTRISSTTYSADFTVSEGGTDVLAGSDIPLSLVLVDSYNSRTTFTTAIAQTADAIDANSPAVAFTSAALTSVAAPVVSGTTEAGATVTAVIAGATYTVLATSGTWSIDTATAVASSGTLGLNANGSNSISVTAIDAAGNPSTAPATQSLVIDTAAATFLSAATSADGSQVILTYSEALAATTAAATAFEVTVGGSAELVTAVVVSGSTVELSLTTPVAGSDAIRISYTASTVDKTTGNDAVQDAAGNDAVSLVAQSVSNHAAGILTGTVKANTGFITQIDSSNAVTIATGDVTKVFDVAGVQSFSVAYGGTLHLSGSQGANIIILVGLTESDLAVSRSGTTVSFWSNGLEVASIGTSEAAPSQTIRIGAADHTLAYSAAAITLDGQVITTVGVHVDALLPAPVI